MWDSDHDSEGADDDESCSLFEYEYKFESIFGPGWRLDFQIDNEVDNDGSSSDDEPSDRRDGEDDNDSDLSDPPSSDYQERIAVEDDGEEGDGGITEDAARLERNTISSLCNLAREELFRSCPRRTDHATHFCCLRSRLTNEMNHFDTEADLFTNEVEIGDFLPTKQWQQQHLYET
eukprot:gene44584-60391_t